MSSGQADYEHIERGLAKLQSALEEERKGMRELGINNLRQTFQEANKNWMIVMKRIRAAMGTQMPKPDYVWLPGENANEFKQELDKAENEFYLVSGSLNPAIGFLRRPEAIDALYQKLKDNPSFRATIVFGRKIMLKNDTNPFLSFWANREEDLPDNLELHTYAQRTDNFDTATALEEYRPPFHCKIMDDRTITCEYPHFEFEHARQRITLDTDVSEEVGEIIEYVKQFYRERTCRVHSKEELRKLIEESRCVESSIVP